MNNNNQVAAVEVITITIDQFREQMKEIARDAAREGAIQAVLMLNEEKSIAPYELVPIESLAKSKGYSKETLFK